MSISRFEQLTATRAAAERRSELLRNQAAEQAERSLHLLWLYPDMLNLHGGRGDIMALLHCADLLELPLEIRRHDALNADAPLEWADMIFLNSGELKCAPQLVAALERQREALSAFVGRQGLLIAVSSTGAVLARETRLEDGTVFAGLGLIDMTMQERSTVWGDDLWFVTEEGIEVIGNQISVVDTEPGAEALPLGRVSYGRGNCSDGCEGAQNGSVIFTNCLGPLLVKNPRLACLWLGRAASAAGIPHRVELDPAQIGVEEQSYELIRKFILGKMGQKQA